MNKIYIKNMVCDRCIMVVTNILFQLELKVAHVALGEVVLLYPPTEKQMQELSEQLRKVGFEIIDDKRSRIIEQIKTCIRELVHRKNGMLKTNLSDYLCGNIHLDYSYLSGLFSEIEGRTIEKYFIFQKIERVKELLAYDDMQLNEIAYIMNYSSVAHLSSQFKKVTGFTPTYFKQMSIQFRKPLDKL